MAFSHRITKQRETFMVRVSNIFTWLWSGEETMMQKQLHPLIAERIERTPSFEWVFMPRHLRMYSN